MNDIVTKLTVEQEISEAKTYGEPLGWRFSDMDTANKKFTVRLPSPIDQQEYILEFQFDKYPELPYLIEFIHPSTEARGTPNCFPKYSGDSFFHPQGIICHPCNRKAYSGYSNLHGDWNMVGWKTIAGSLTTLTYVLDAIYTRITDKNFYNGRMA